MEAVALFLFGVAVALALAARHIAVSRRRATFFAAAVLVSAGMNLFALALVGNPTTRLIELVAAITLTCAVHLWARNVHQERR